MIWPEAVFAVQGVTVQMLYYFAIVYNMSYFTNNQADFEILDHDSDIEINLFRDYYDNNLTRFLSESMTNRAGGLEYDADRPRHQLQELRGNGLSLLPSARTI